MDVILFCEINNVVGSFARLIWKKMLWEGSEGRPWRLLAAKTPPGGRESFFWRGPGGILEASWGCLGAPGGLPGVILERPGRRLGASWGSPDHLGGLRTLSWAPKTDSKSVLAAIFSWISFVSSF